jgi:hypothetical protein
VFSGPESGQFWQPIGSATTFSDSGYCCSQAKWKRSGTETVKSAICTKGLRVTFPPGSLRDGSEERFHPTEGKNSALPGSVWPRKSIRGLATGAIRRRRRLIERILSQKYEPICDALDFQDYPFLTFCLLIDLWPFLSRPARHPDCSGSLLPFPSVPWPAYRMRKVR